jgi:hypothetical protein
VRRLVARGRWTEHVFHFVLLRDGAVVVALSVRAVEPEHIAVGCHVSSGLLLTFGLATTEHVFRCLQNMRRLPELIRINRIIVIVVVMDVIVEGRLPRAGYLSGKFIYHLVETLPLPLLVVLVVVVCGMWVVVVADFLVCMSLFCLCEVVCCCCGCCICRSFYLSLSHRH